MRHKFTTTPVKVCCLIQMLLICNCLKAQVLRASDINKIYLEHDIITLHGSSETVYEIVRENDHWTSKQTEGFDRKYSTKGWDTVQKIDRQFSAKLNVTLIDSFVNAINRPDTIFAPQLIGLTASLLKDSADSFYKYQLSNLSTKRVNNFKNFITEKKVLDIRLPEYLFMELGGDYYDGWSIKIIKKRGDAISLFNETGFNALSCWTNDRHTKWFNPKIDNFCAYAKGKTLSENILFKNKRYYDAYYKNLYTDYCKKYFPIGRSGVDGGFFEEGFLYRFQGYFEIKDLDVDHISKINDTVYKMTLKYRYVSADIPIYTFFHSGDPTLFDRVTNCAGLMEYFFKHETFLPVSSTKYSMSFSVADSVNIKYNAIREKYSHTNTLPTTNKIEAFQIQNKNSAEISYWYALPNGEFLLYKLKGPTLLSYKPTDLGLERIPDQITEVALLIDAKGKMISNLDK